MNMLTTPLTWAFLGLVIAASALGCGKSHDSACGPPVECRSGVCCDETVRADVDEATCRTTCPEGTSLSCTPDPRCDAEPECDTPADCAIRLVGCCEACSGNEYAAYGPEALEEYDALCGTVDCAPPPCPAPPPPPTFLADCVANQCVAVDYRVNDFSRCEVDEDCTLALDGCCDCGGRLVAIAASQRDAFGRLACPDATIDCPLCEPMRPVSRAACVDNTCERIFEEDAP